jgi:hypothetical protein
MSNPLLFLMGLENLIKILLLNLLLVDDLFPFFLEISVKVSRETNLSKLRVGSGVKRCVSLDKEIFPRFS